MLNRHSNTPLALKFQKKFLLETLRKNRAEHEKDYGDAQKEYGKQLVATLERKLAAAKEGQKVRHVIDLLEPTNFLVHYDRAISMLENSTDDVIELDHVLYSQLVQDDWEWKDQFSNSTLNYTSKAPRGGSAAYGV